MAQGSFGLQKIITNSEGAKMISPPSESQIGFFNVSGLAI